MNIPIFQSGDAVPARRYRDIGNGAEIRLKRDSVLPLDGDGHIALYVPLIDRRPKRVSVEPDCETINKRIDELIEARLALYERTQNGV